MTAIRWLAYFQSLDARVAFVRDCPLFNQQERTRMVAEFLEEHERFIKIDCRLSILEADLSLRGYIPPSAKIA
jgi:hypothetical protein